MPFTKLQKQDYAFFADSLTESTWIVACFCADWCGSCRSWYESFQGLSEKYPEVSFIWIDIEDHADLMGNLDAESFPCLLIQYGDIVNFFGAIHPDAKVAERLLNNNQAYDIAEMKARAASSDEHEEWQEIANLRTLFKEAAQSA